MAWKRSSVRSRPGPPCFQLLADTPLFSLVAFGSKTLIPRATSSKYRKESKLGTDGVDRLLHALRNLLHVNVSCHCDAGAPEHALDVLHRPLLLRQRRNRAPDLFRDAISPVGNSFIVAAILSDWAVRRFIDSGRRHPLVSGPIPRADLGVVRRSNSLPALHAGSWIADLHGFCHAAAGSGHVFLLHYAGGDVLGFWFSHPHHAAMAPVSDLCQPAALLLDRIAGHVPERRRHGYSLAANAGDVLPGSRITHGSRAALSQSPRLTRAAIVGTLCATEGVPLLRSLLCMDESRNETFLGPPTHDQQGKLDSFRAQIL